MPVFLAVASEDHVPGVQLNDLLPPSLDQAPSLSDAQGLAAIVGMPGAAGTRSEMNGGHANARGRQPTGDRVNPYLAGECLGRPFGRRWFAREFQLLVLLPTLCEKAANESHSITVSA